MLHVDTAPAKEISRDTEELALELGQPKIDPFRIKWLIEDCGADVGRALILAHLKEQDLLKRPALRPLGLQRYLREQH